MNIVIRKILILVVLVTFVLGCQDMALSSGPDIHIPSLLEETSDGLGIKFSIANPFSFESREVEYSVFVTDIALQPFYESMVPFENKTIFDYLSNDQYYIVYNSSAIVPTDGSIEVTVLYSDLLNESDSGYLSFISSAAPTAHYGVIIDPDRKVAETDISDNWVLSEEALNGFFKADNYEMNETSATSTIIIFNLDNFYNESFSLSFPTDEDWITFIASETGNFLLSTVDHDKTIQTPIYVPEVDTVIYLYDEDLNQLAMNDDKTDSILSSTSYSLTSGEKYFIKVTGKTNTDIGAYYLEIEHTL